MGTSEAPRRPDAGDGCSIAGTRRCLHPQACPYAARGGGHGVAVRTWESAMLDLLPGDPDLALELVSVLLGERSPGTG